MRKTNTGFTLVELIVVITILAILGTIAFISMSGYSATSRDSVRLADASSMRTSLEIYQVNSGKYPLPDQNAEFIYNSETLWTQGKFSGTVISNLSRNFSEAPLDPLQETTYIYSVAGNKNEYQLLVLLEGDENTLNTINATNAATSKRTPKVSGTYNGLYVKTATNFYAFPSLISSVDYTVGTPTTLTGGMMKSMVVNGFENVPGEGNVEKVVGDLDLPETIYSIALVTTNDGDTAKANVVKMLQNAYSGSKLKNEGIIKYIVDLDGETDEILAGVLDTVVLGNAADAALTLSDTTPPADGTFNINQGTGTVYLKDIDLSIGCPSESGVEMYISGDVTGTGVNSWSACNSSASLVLNSGDGLKTINMKFKDTEGNETDNVTSSITLDDNVFYTTWLTAQQFETISNKNGKTGWTKCYDSAIHGGSQTTMNSNCNGLGSSSIVVFKTDTLTAGQKQTGPINQSSNPGGSACQNFWLGQFPYIIDRTCDVERTSPSSGWFRTDHSGNRFYCNQGDIGSITCNMQQYSNGNSRWNNQTLWSGSQPTNNATLRYFAVWYQ